MCFLRDLIAVLEVAVVGFVEYGSSEGDDSVKVVRLIWLIGGRRGIKVPDVRPELLAPAPAPGASPPDLEHVGGVDLR